MTMQMTRLAVEHHDVLVRHSVEQAMPGHMMFMAMEAAERQGWEFRSDVKHYVNLASILPLRELDDFSVARAAGLVEDHATTLMRDLNADDPIEAMLAVCLFVLKLVDEGLNVQPDSNPVMVALLTVEDLRAPDSDWRVNEPRAAGKAQAMLRRANLLGYYTVSGREKLRRAKLALEAG